MADALSWVPIFFVSSYDVDYRSLNSLQQSNDDIHDYLMAITGLELHDVILPFVSKAVPCDFSPGSPQPVVPPTFHRKIFDLFHSLSHSSVRANQGHIGD